ncbi:hypothetical protein R533_18030 [Salmonella enterica subsp. houtenae serovar 40:z4,z32:-]|nr:hypothetical protein [Salmonella enterica]OSD42028.1 hypothetical protein R533_18030 [Salmonella enterica subsp. houtenae serovar 40:z4,z32:-]OSD75335.1 hypothetical protein R529_17680 [Salmonella enterica subsp. houtenae serovar 40:z4,z32:-]OSD88369.1 hypothetical protein R526_19765 [Salmonella enterica subsp. houtenae serovar 40:z4,z32:-]OSE25819.1 hypothetical protein R517_22275 [Salmonella enterica subsp. houtenae serovar 40:z4,z32:-]
MHIISFLSNMTLVSNASCQHGKINIGIMLNKEMIVAITAQCMAGMRRMNIRRVNIKNVGLIVASVRDKECSALWLMSDIL